MEKRKESLSDIKVCRFCLCKDSTLSSLYDRSRDPILVTLPLKIMACVSIEVFPSDKMPSYICERCRTFMDLCYDFKQICRRADESCLQFVQNGIPISAINWPPSLTKIFQLTKKARPANTVDEGTAIIQVSSQDENDEEETYNIEINPTGEGSQSFTNQASVSNEKEQPTTATKKEAVRKGVMVRVRRRSAGLGNWPCDLCQKSYSLHQLLEIHKAEKHCARSARCAQCQSIFFSKYDLMTHKLRHANETPFQCVACNSKFRRLILLKRHEKMAHSDLPKHLCTNCPVTFLSKEELEAHKKRHEGYFSRQHVCSICDRKFHTKGTLLRHKDIIHGKKRFSCEYCPLRFTTVSKLARHVRAHAGDRAFPCKYCNKSFLKSHHYARHLRLKHEAEVNAASGADAEFRCEQCGEDFATQDDLYYHSAIHATQSLTCPLCQEQFENVDAVTAHIRTHVNGIEFMCEYCELVFTSKEKLDAHMSAAHDDEITPRPEMAMDESSVEEVDGGEADADDDDEDNGLNVKEEGDLMVVEIKKMDGYMLSKDIEAGQTINTTSEESEVDSGCAEVPADKPAAAAAANPEATTSKATSSTLSKFSERIGILRKAEAVKRKAADKEACDTPHKKRQPAKVDSTTNNSPANSSELSLRMLERELQELTRTNARSEKRQRQQVHSCTPKVSRPVEEKKAVVKPASEKKAPERRPVTKDTREAKEARNPVSSSKEDKSVSSTREERAAEPSKSEMPSTSSTSAKRDSVEAAARDDPESAKNGDASSSEDNIVRRSTRPSKIKNYASMARDGAGHVQDEDDEGSSQDVEIVDVKEADSRTVPTRRSAAKRQLLAASQPLPSPVVLATFARRRGRPRKDPGSTAKDGPEETPAEAEAPADDAAARDAEGAAAARAPEPAPAAAAVAPVTINDQLANDMPSSSSSTPAEPPLTATLVSPTGQTLKKVSIQALPPGIKPLPLPLNARRDVCEMKIGKKMVKVQKIVMTKAEVEAMAKKGLLELKDGTMVLKQGIKLPDPPNRGRSVLMSQGAINKISTNAEGEET